MKHNNAQTLSSLLDLFKLDVDPFVVPFVDIVFMFVFSLSHWQMCLNSLWNTSIKNGKKNKLFSKFLKSLYKKTFNQDLKS